MNDKSGKESNYLYHRYVSTVPTSKCCVIAFTEYFRFCLCSE